MAPRTGQRQQVVFWGGGLGGAWLVLRWARSLSRPRRRGLIGERTQHGERRLEMQPGEEGARAPGATRERGHRGAASGCMRGVGGEGFRKGPG